MAYINNLFQKVKENNFIRDSFWALTSNMFAKGMALVTSIIIARFLGKEIFGEYSTIRSLLISISTLSIFGLGLTTTKFIAEYKTLKPTLVHLVAKQSIKISTFLSLTISLIFFIFSDYIATDILEQAKLSISLKIISFWIYFNSVTTTQIGILAGFKIFKDLLRINLIIGVFSLIASTTFVWFFGLNGVLAALLFSQILNWILIKNLVNKVLSDFPIKETQKGVFFLIFKFSIPVAFQAIINALTNWSAIYVLIKLSNYSSIGIYNASIQWGVLIIFIPMALSNVLLSHLSEKKQSSKNNKSFFNKILFITLIITTLLFLLIVLFSNQIISFYGANYFSMKPVIIACSAATIFISLIEVFSQFYMIHNKNWEMFFIKLLKGIGVVLLTYYLIAFKFIDGALSLAISSLFLNALFVSYFFIRYINYKKIKI